MKIVGMSEDDLNGELFVNFPDSMSMSECRDYMELLISDVYEDDFRDIPDEDRPEMVISPFWVMRALMRMAVKEFDAMSEEEKTIVRRDFWNRRVRKGD